MEADNNEWFLQHCARVLMDAGYAVIHRDRLQTVHTQISVSKETLEAMKPDFTQSYMAHLELNAAAEIGKHLLGSGLIVRKQADDESAQRAVYAWGTCVVAPRTDG